MHISYFFFDICFKSSCWRETIKYFNFHNTVSNMLNVSNFSLFYGFSCKMRTILILLNNKLIDFDFLHRCDTHRQRRTGHQPVKEQRQPEEHRQPECDRVQLRRWFGDHRGEASAAPSFAPEQIEVHSATGHRHNPRRRRSSKPCSSPSICGRSSEVEPAWRQLYDGWPLQRVSAR